MTCFMSREESLLRFWWNFIILMGERFSLCPLMFSSCSFRAVNHSWCLFWQMALPVAKINAKLGPSELASQFQAEIKHTQQTLEVMGWFTNGCINILFGHFYRKRTYQRYALQQTISDIQWMSSPAAAVSWWPGAAGICMCLDYLDYFLKQLFTWAVNIYSVFIQDQINIFLWNKH